jgi:capsule polysaccharide export protein KpsE/RkpR
MEKTLRTEAGMPIDGALGHDVLDVLLVLSTRWRKIAVVMALALAAGVMVSYFAIKPSYTSVALILPPSSPQSMTSTLLGQPGPEKQAKTSADTYVGILNSQSIADRIIDRFRLQSVWKLKTMADTRTELRSEVQIEATDFDAIQITVRDHDARQASDLANAFVSELNRIDGSLAIAEAAHRSQFLGREVKVGKSALAQAEDRLKGTQQQTGMISPERQANLAIQEIGRLQAEIDRRNVALQSMRSYATDSNPQVIGLKAEIDGLQRQLRKLQNESRSPATGDTQIPANQLAETAIQYRRALRDVTEDETVSASLISQMEAARIDEAGSAPPAPVIDRATVADEMSGPQRTYLWAAACWVGFTATCLCIFLKQAMVQAEQNPDEARQWMRLRQAFGIRMNSGAKPETFRFDRS